jgi:hypothetical protein
MLTFITSAHARKCYRLLPQKSAPEAYWHENWRLDDLENAPCGYGAMITNTETLFTILVPDPQCDSFDQLLEHFRMRLQFTLIDAGSPVQLDDGPPCIISGNPRRVIGTMNDMKFALALEADEPSPAADDLEDYLNRTPYSAIDYAYPCERFYEMAKTAE